MLSAAGHVADAAGASAEDHLPCYVFRPHVLAANVRAFRETFPGSVAYAVKANMDRPVVETILAQGIRSFDVASIREIRLMRTFGADLRLLYMNPVKPAGSIAEAYREHGVRSFAVDSDWELEKVLAATGGGGDLDVYVRLAVDNGHAKIALSNKFGIAPRAAAPLLRAAAGSARRVGLCFHVGSQCETVDAFRDGLAEVAGLMRELPGLVSIVDIGGGFPAGYGAPGFSLERHLRAVRAAVESALPAGAVDLVCEPGRALVANAQSLIVTVLGRKGDFLYLNDGLYGGIFEPDEDFAFPVRLLRGSTAAPRPFRLFGPTCDGTDLVKATVMLPGDIAIGDQVEFGHMGAYSSAFRSDFNGFGASRLVTSDSDAF